MAGTQTALATSVLTCSNADAQLELRLLLDADETLGPVTATMRLDTLFFTTDAGDNAGTPLTIAQSYFSPTLTQVDFRDDAVNHMIAQLRLVTAEEGSMYVRAGTLRVYGHGAWPVECGESD